jgi:hypothetical protein
MATAAVVFIIFTTTDYIIYAHVMPILRFDEEFRACERKRKMPNAPFPLPGLHPVRDKNYCDIPEKQAKDESPQNQPPPDKNERTSHRLSCV